MPDLTITVTQAQADRILPAMGYDAAVDGPAVDFARRKIRGYLIKLVRKYEENQNTATFIDNFVEPVDEI